MPSYPQSPTSFHDIATQLRQLTAERFSGSFRAEQGGVVKVLYLCDGLLACASSTDSGDRLGTLLEREGLITAEQRETAQDRALPGEALGSVLINLGYIESDDLLRGARLQVEEVLHSILLWKAGAFRSRPGPLPERAVNLKLELGPVLMACVQRIEDDETVAELLGPGDRVLCTLPDADHKELGNRAAMLLDLLDGSRDLDSVYAEVELDPALAARMVLGFKALGIVEEGPAMAAAAFATMDEADDSPQESAESHADGHVDAEERLEETADPQQVREDEPEPLSTQTPSAGPPLVSPQLTATVARRDLPRTLDEGGAGEAHAQLPFDEPGSFDRHLEEDRRDEADDLPPEDETGYGPPPGGEPPQGRRGWIVAVALPLVALLLVFLFSGSDNPPPLNTTTGDEPAGSEAPQEAPSDPPAGEVLSPSAAPEPTRGTPVQLPTPAPADVAIPRPEGTLESSSGYEAGFDAFQAGDFDKAAALWQRDWQSRRPGGFTLQVMVACQEATLRTLRPRIPTSDRLFLVPVQVNDSTCYKVLWGTYADRAEAEAAASTVPSLFLSGGNSPWPVPLASLEP